MYNEEWMSVMTANTMEEKISEIASLARRRTDSSDREIRDIVYNIIYDSYLLKHTTGDVLRELIELENLYPDAFYDGAANDHLMNRYEDLRESDVEVWSDYMYLALAAGLEWAVLNELEGVLHT